MGLQRVGHDWVIFTLSSFPEKEANIYVFLENRWVNTVNPMILEWPNHTSQGVYIAKERMILAYNFFLSHLWIDVEIQSKI